MYDARLELFPVANKKGDREIHYILVCIILPRALYAAK